MVDRRYWDVELPDRSDAEESRAAACFMALCGLTRVLSEVLPLIYSVAGSWSSSDIEQLKSLELDLSQWHDELPTWLMRDYGSASSDVEGLLNLQLSYFSVKLTIARLSLRFSSSSSLIGTREQALQACHRAALRISEFVQNLSPDNVNCFWMPYTAANCTMTATVVLRCFFEQRGTESSSICLDACQKFLRRLRFLSEQNLADGCLKQYADIVESINIENHTTGDLGQNTVPEVSKEKALPGLDWGFDDVFSIDLFGEPISDTQLLG